MTNASQCRGNVSLPERPPGYGAACMSEGWEIASIDGAESVPLQFASFAFQI